MQNEAGQRLIEFCQENALVRANTLLHNTREDSTHGHHQMANTESRLIIFFAAKDGRRSIRSAKTRLWLRQELLIDKFRLKLKKGGKPLDHSGMN